MKPIESIEPADCYVHAVQLAAATEQLRRSLGRPADARPAIKVSGASPRECWFAALALHHKAARLAAELAVDAAALEPAPPVDKLRPGHVLQVIEASQRLVDAVRRATGDDHAVAVSERDPKRTPSDVFGELATTSRALDLLLEKPTTPGEVFAQTMLALRYAERLYGDRRAAAPSPSHGKSPSDCLARLQEAFDLARAAIKKAGHPTLEQTAGAGDAAKVRPSDCYDLATIVLGELAFLHAHAPDANPPAAYAQIGAGHKLPSHVHTLTGQLVAQLQTLSR